MSFEEKLTWVSTFVTIVVTAVYAWTVAGQMAGTPVAEIVYQVPMIVAVGSIVAMTIVGSILMSIGAAISDQITGEGSLKEIDRKDERDVNINRRGELIGYYVLSVGALGVLALAMMRFDPFWIANALFLSLMLAGTASSVAKLVVYRRGY
ncbi:MAG: hypothetical protein Q7W30_05590 [Coriobacteriia bacterium]|nr:hypothetical protein [Coriobacteriia bacterium]